jgi:hypothetical protein
MKKYKLVYVIIYILLLILVFTRGIDGGIVVSSYNDGMIDGFSRCNILLIYNYIIMVSIFVVSLIITFIKNNKVKCKSLIFIGIIILLLLIPTSEEHRSGGEAGINHKIYSNILKIQIGKNY